MRRTLNAFSLVELSIVLVILGLLVGSVLSGQALIKGAQRRSIIAEYNKYTTALGSFRDKYFALPGDMANATQFWGVDIANCPGAPGTVMTPGTCNGDASNYIGFGVDQAGEGVRVWQHLSNAGMIEGAFPGVLVGGVQAVAGVTNPASKYGQNSGWQLLWRNPASGGTLYNYKGNVFLLAQTYGPTWNTLWQSIMTPEEAWNIDSKTDDGKPSTGVLMGGGDTTFCITPNSNETVPAVGAVYNLSNTTLSCRLWFIVR